MRRVQCSNASITAIKARSSVYFISANIFGAAGTVAAAAAAAGCDIDTVSIVASFIACK